MPGDSRQPFCRNVSFQQVELFSMPTKIELRKHFFKHEKHGEYFEIFCMLHFWKRQVIINLKFLEDKFTKLKYLIDKRYLKTKKKKRKKVT